MDTRLPVLITVDVELAGSAASRLSGDLQASLDSLDCLVDGRPMGLPFILDTLDANGLKATFFVDPFSFRYFGEDKLDAVLDRIGGRGHDIQLHLHPSWHWLREGRQSVDNLFSYSTAEQETLIEMGMDAFKKRGVTPKAFRAGSFSANNSTFAALRKLGFTLGSSYNFSSLGDTCKIEVEGLRNDAFENSGLIEVPITNYLVRDLRKCLGFAPKTFQVGCTPFVTAREILRAGRAGGYSCVNLLLHNFEFVDRRRDDWLQRPMRKLKETSDGFFNLCRHLAEHSHEYRSATFSEMDHQWKTAGPPAIQANPSLPRINRLHLPLDLLSLPGGRWSGVKPIPEPQAGRAGPIGKVRDYLGIAMVTMENFSRVASEGLAGILPALQSTL